MKPGPIPLQIRSWNGVRVVRLASPEPLGRTSRPTRRAALPLVVSQEGFDLVHAHAIQVLGVGPLRVAAELGIPYALTLHDGWWLSRQFLLTPLGRPVDLTIRSVTMMFLIASPQSSWSVNASAARSWSSCRRRQQRGSPCRTHSRFCIAAPASKRSR